MQSMNEVMPKRYQVVAVAGNTVKESNDLGTLTEYQGHPDKFEIHDTITGQKVGEGRQSESLNEG